MNNQNDSYYKNISKAYWDHKLLNFLHDPVIKALDIPNHIDIAKSLQIKALPAGNYNADGVADTIAATADRIPFPIAQKLSVDYNGEFHHPFCNGRLQFPAISKADAEIVQNSNQPVFQDKDLNQFQFDDEKARANYFSHWRIWPQNCLQNDPRLYYMPADTRIPDHSIWLHNAITSALSDIGTPAFLKVQIGPVQDFIAAARTTRDLWSGSYLLSWLMSVGLKTVALNVGPDSVIFPNLFGQPLFDLQCKEDIWSKIPNAEMTQWDWITKSDASFSAKLVTPNLPNVFLALVPYSKSKELAKEIVRSIKAEWTAIAESVWNYCDSLYLSDKKQALTADESDITRKERKERFFKQIDQFLRIDYQITPWKKSIGEALDLKNKFDDEAHPISLAYKNLNATVVAGTQLTPLDDRDGRYYVNGDKTILRNIGLTWPMLVAYNAWELDCTRKTLAYSGWKSSGWDVGTMQNKDVLNGKEEAVAGGKEWKIRWAQIRENDSSLQRRFKHNDWVGASTLVKRLWDIAYLKEKWGIASPSQPNVQDIAKACNESDNREEDVETVDGKYHAVLALDGDEMGKWISGGKSPQVSNQLHSKAKAYYESVNATDFLESKRPLTPSYHLQFSQALGNFALHCARPIVEHHGGKLIYAGGDDVLAILPASKVFTCAQDLRDAFRGDLKTPVAGIETYKNPSGSDAPGFLQLKHLRTKTGKQDKDQEAFIPILVPGTMADVSVGIAIGHIKAPIQDMVRTAQYAEKRAKNTAALGLGRGSVAASLMKRSGEIVEWGTRWDDQGLALLKNLQDKIGDQYLSNKFPYRWAELLTPYVTIVSPIIKEQRSCLTLSEAKALIVKEFEFTLSRQIGEKKLPENDREELINLLNDYLDKMIDKLTSSDNVSESMSIDYLFKTVIDFCATLGFIKRL